MSATAERTDHVMLKLCVVFLFLSFPKLVPWPVFQHQCLESVNQWLVECVFIKGGNRVYCTILAGFGNLERTTEKVLWVRFEYFAIIWMQFARNAIAIVTHNRVKCSVLSYGVLHAWLCTLSPFTPCVNPPDGPRSIPGGRTFWLVRPFFGVQLVLYSILDITYRIIC